MYYNKCSKCISNHVFYYDEDSLTSIVIDYGKCIYNRVDKCYASNEESKCKLCENGFYLNKDKQCEKVQIEFCESPEVSVIYDKNFKGNKLNYLIATKPHD